MKYFFFILLVISPFVLCQDPVFTELNVTEVSSDPAIVDMLNFGLQTIVPLGKQEGILSQSVYEIAEVYSIGYSSGALGDSYKFEVRLVDPQQNSIDATFVILKSARGEKTVTSYFFGTNPTTTTSSIPSEAGSDYTPLNVDEALTDPKITEMILLGYNYIIPQGVQDGTLVDTQYQISYVSRIWLYVNATGQNYKFELEIADLQDNAFNATYVIFNETATGVMTAESYSFGPWVPLDLNQVSSNQELSNVGMNGLQFVIAKGVEEGVLPQSDFSQTELASVEEQKVEGGWNYRWTSWIANSVGDSAQAIYITFYEPSSGFTEVLAYEFFEVVLV